MSLPRIARVVVANYKYYRDVGKDDRKAIETEKRRTSKKSR